MSVNKLILGDNLEILKSMDADSVDLIYLDPPFFSNRNYEVIWGDAGEVRSFQDRWAGGVDRYIAWLKERIAEMRRILKPSDSIFLHCGGALTPISGLIFWTGFSAWIILEVN
jgi:site-specific DNA-methyltransferase (adenine-specific)